MSATAGDVYIALLRGINVGGKNILPMRDLAALLVAEGCESVRTYIQSGNVVFRADAKIARTFPETLEAAIHKKTKLKVPVVLRSAKELSETIAQNPYLAEGADEGTLHLAFAATRPTKAQIASLDPNRSPPDSFRVVGNHIYLCLPNGAGKTKFTNTYLDAKLGTVTTGRNWRTVRKLKEIADSLAAG